MMSTFYIYCTNFSHASGANETTVSFDLDLWFSGAEVVDGGLIYDMAGLTYLQFRDKVVRDAINSWNVNNPTAPPIEVSDTPVLVNFPQILSLSQMFHDAT